jgi:molybdenum cofactor synthesis domain-containing protein
MKVAILTVSDRSAAGEREDRSGPLLKELVETQGWFVTEIAILPDDQERLEKQLVEWCDEESVDIIFTTGGTGFAPRDRTPEATLKVIEREAPGLAEAMRLASLRKTPHAMLSRAVAGIRKSTLIINLPGSPRGAKENLQAILEVLPHAVDLLREDPGAETGHERIPPIQYI